jgi:hypothetical protein
MFPTLLSWLLHLPILSVNKMFFFFRHVIGHVSATCDGNCTVQVARFLCTLSGHTKYTGLFAAVCRKPPCCAVYQYHAVAAVPIALQERCEIAVELCVCCVDCPSVCGRINRKPRFKFLLPRTVLTASMHEDVLVCGVCVVVCVCV